MTQSRTWPILTRVLLVALALSASLSSGCLWIALGAVGAGIAGNAYCKGKVGHLYLADLADARAATHTALAELGMQVLKEEEKKGELFVKSCAADGERVRIYLEQECSRIPADGPLTRISVRVGTFGDHPLSERVLYQIGAHLVPAPAVVPPPCPPPAPPAPAVAAPPPSAPPTLQAPEPGQPATAPPPRPVEPPLAR